MDARRLVPVAVTLAALVLLAFVAGATGGGVVSNPATGKTPHDLLADPHTSTYSNDNGKAQVPRIELPRDITFADGANYRIRVHDEDHGGTITVVPPVNGTATEGSWVVVNLPEPGEIDGDFAFWLPRGSLTTDGPVDAPITVQGDVATTGIVNLSVSFVDAGTGSTVFHTETQPHILNYREGFTQEGTTGRITLVVERSVLPKRTNLTGTVYSANSTFPGETGDKTAVAFAYDERRDAFVATVDAAELEGGNYSLSLWGDLPAPYGTSFEHFMQDTIRVESSESGNDEPTGPPPVTGTARPGDPDADGLYEDVNGDGSVTPGDATVLFNAVFEENAAVTDHVVSFDFNGDGSVTPGDATVLFDEAFGG